MTYAKKNPVFQVASLKCYWNEIFVSEIMALFCTWKYANHRERIRFCQKKPESGIF